MPGVGVIYQESEMIGKGTETYHQSHQFLPKSILFQLLDEELDKELTV